MSNARPISWFRPSPARGIIKVALISGCLMTVGVVIMAFGVDLSGRVSSSLQPWLIIIGITMVISGVCIACWGFYFVLSKDSSTLVLQTDGLSYIQQESSFFISWVEIEDISFENNRIIIHKKTGEIKEIEEVFLGTTTAKLVDEIKDVQRKTLLGVIC